MNTYNVKPTRFYVTEYFKNDWIVDRVQIEPHDKFDYKRQLDRQFMLTDKPGLLICEQDINLTPEQFETINMDLTVDLTDKTIVFPYMLYPKSTALKEPVMSMRCSNFNFYYKTVPETDLFGLGLTYIPKAVWFKCSPTTDVLYNMLDTVISVKHHKLYGRARVYNGVGIIEHLNK